MKGRDGRENRDQGHCDAMWLSQGVSCFRSGAGQIYGFVLRVRSQPALISHLGGSLLCSSLLLFLWLGKLHVPRWSRLVSLSSAYRISAWDRSCVSGSARQNQTGSKGALFSCSCHTALCHCSAWKLNLTVLLYGRHEPGSWPRAAKAVMFFQCGFSFLYSPPTLGLATLPMATCPAKREQELLWFLWVLEPANVL